jgi:GGDEF domain-containing protein
MPLDTLDPSTVVDQNVPAPSAPPSVPSGLTPLPAAPITQPYDPDAQAIVNELGQRGIFASDPDAKAIRDELGHRGVIVNPNDPYSDSDKQVNTALQNELNVYNQAQSGLSTVSDIFSNYQGQVAAARGAGIVPQGGPDPTMVNNVLQLPQRPAPSSPVQPPAPVAAPSAAPAAEATGPVADIKGLAQGALKLPQILTDLLGNVAQGSYHSANAAVAEVQGDNVTADRESGLAASSLNAAKDIVGNMFGARTDGTGIVNDLAKAWGTAAGGDTATAQKMLRQIGQNVLRFTEDHPVNQALNLLPVVGVAKLGALGGAARLSQAADMAEDAGNLAKAAQLRTMAGVAKMAVHVADTPARLAGKAARSVLNKTETVPPSTAFGLDNRGQIVRQTIPGSSTSTPRFPAISSAAQKVADAATSLNNAPRSAIEAFKASRLPQPPAPLGPFADSLPGAQGAVAPNVRTAGIDLADNAPAPSTPAPNPRFANFQVDGEEVPPEAPGTAPAPPQATPAPSTLASTPQAAPEPFSPEVIGTLKQELETYQGLPSGAAQQHAQNLEETITRMEEANAKSQGEANAGSILPAGAVATQRADIQANQNVTANSGGQSTGTNSGATGMPQSVNAGNISTQSPSGSGAGQMAATDSNASTGMGQNGQGLAAGNQNENRADATRTNVSPKGFISDYQHERDRQFADYRDTLTAAGTTLTPQATAALKAKVDENTQPYIDPATGLLSNVTLDRTLDRAAQHVQETGEPAHYFEADVQNLGGLNTNISPSEADGVMRQLADYIQGEISHLGGHLSFYKAKGDELGGVVAGPSTEALSNALAAAKQKADAWVKSTSVGGQPLATVPHSKKGKAPGTGFVYGLTPILPGMSAKTAREIGGNLAEQAKVAEQQKLRPKRTQTKAVAPAAETAPTSVQETAPVQMVQTVPVEEPKQEAAPAKQETVPAPSATVKPLQSVNEGEERSLLSYLERTTRQASRTLPALQKAHFSKDLIARLQGEGKIIHLLKSADYVNTKKGTTRLQELNKRLEEGETAPKSENKQLAALHETLGTEAKPVPPKVTPKPKPKSKTVNPKPESPAMTAFKDLLSERPEPAPLRKSAMPTPKVQANGFTKEQQKFLGDALREAMPNLPETAKVSQSGKGTALNPISTKTIDYAGAVTIKVPGDGTFTVASQEQARNLLKSIGEGEKAPGKPIHETFFKDAAKKTTGEYNFVYGEYKGEAAVGHTSMFLLGEPEMAQSAKAGGAFGVKDFSQAIPEGAKNPLTLQYVVEKWGGGRSVIFTGADGKQYNVNKPYVDQIYSKGYSLMGQDDPTKTLRIVDSKGKTRGAVAPLIPLEREPEQTFPYVAPKVIKAAVSAEPAKTTPAPSVKAPLVLRDIILKQLNRFKSPTLEQIHKATLPLTKRPNISAVKDELAKMMDEGLITEDREIEYDPRYSLKSNAAALPGDTQIENMAETGNYPPGSTFNAFVNPMHVYNAAKTLYLKADGSDQVLAAKDALMNNLSALEHRGSALSLLRARELAGSSGKVSVAMSAAASEITRLLGNNPAHWQTFLHALAESRLRGIRARWATLAADAHAAKDDDLVVKKVERGVTSHSLDPKYAFPAEMLSANDGFKGLATEAHDAAISNDAGAVRALLTKAFATAAANVPHIAGMDQPGDLTAVMSQSGFPEALKVYKDTIEAELAHSHSENEGVFSTALGPLDSYFPLVPLDEDGEPIGGNAGSRAEFASPGNANNRFATGQAKDYAVTTEDLRRSMQRAFRRNAQAALMDSLEADKLLVSPDSPAVVHDKDAEGRRVVTMTHKGRTYPARLVPISTDKMIVGKGNPVFIAGQSRVAPQWLIKELGPMLHSTLPEWGGGARSLPGKELLGGLNTVGLAGPLDAIFHSANLLGTIVSEVPWIKTGKGAVLDVAVNNALLKLPGTIAALIHTDATSEANLGNLREMARMGLVPPRYGEVTTNAAVAANTGARLVSGVKSAFKGEHLEAALFGEKGIDIRARLIMYRAAKTMMGLDPNKPLQVTSDGAFNDPKQATELAHFVDRLGQYNRALESDIVRFIKDTRLAPFATAGAAMLRNGLRFWLRSADPTSLPGGERPNGRGGGSGGPGGNPGANGRSFGKTPRRIANKLSQQLTGGALALVTLWGMGHKLLTGQWPWQDRKSRFLQWPVPQGFRTSRVGQDLYGMGDDQAYVSLGGINPIGYRGASALGMRGYYDTRAQGGTRGQGQEAAMQAGMNASLHPFVSGPAFNTLFEAAFLHEPYITSMRDPTTGKPNVQIKAIDERFAPGAAGYAEALPGIVGGGVNPSFGTALGAVGVGPKASQMRRLSGEGKVVKTVIDLAFPRLIGGTGDETAQGQRLMRSERLAEAQDIDIPQALQSTLMGKGISAGALVPAGGESEGDYNKRRAAVGRALARVLPRVMENVSSRPEGIQKSVLTKEITAVKRDFKARTPGYTQSRALQALKNKSFLP